jgi:hypothetical protein
VHLINDDIGFSNGGTTFNNHPSDLAYDVSTLGVFQHLGIRNDGIATPGL